ncbi:MAG: hypothetical protein NZM07_10390 [Elioraea sp.]|nr:hypothetical protein [Elioraea sp.]
MPAEAVVEHDGLALWHVKDEVLEGDAPIAARARPAQRILLEQREPLQGSVQAGEVVRPAVAEVVKVEGHLEVEGDTGGDALGLPRPDPVMRLAADPVDQHLGLLLEEGLRRLALARPVVVAEWSVAYHQPCRPALPVLQRIAEDAKHWIGWINRLVVVEAPGLPVLAHRAEGPFQQETQLPVIEEPGM